MLFGIKQGAHVLASRGLTYATEASGKDCATQLAGGCMWIARPGAAELFQRGDKYRPGLLTNYFY